METAGAGDRNLKRAAGPKGERQLIVLDGPPVRWRLPSSVSGTAVTVGVFDGVHRGHQRLLAELVARAAPSGLAPAVATFDPHPLAVLAPEMAPRMLTSISHRLEILEGIGIGVVGVMPFSEVREMEADEFVTEVLLERLRANLVVVGENFRFGKGGKGSSESLRRAGSRHGFSVEVVGLLGADALSDSSGDPINSSRIRRCLAEGRTGEAAELLGRPFELRGTVIRGEQRGAELGIPTANLEISPGMSMPAIGIYAVWAEFDSERHPAAVNIGVRPTFGESRLMTEAHLLDFSGDLYGKRMKLCFVGDRIRTEIRFGSVDELLAQVGRDIAEVRVRLGT